MSFNSVIFVILGLTVAQSEIIVENDVVFEEIECDFFENMDENRTECGFNPDMYLSVPQIISRHGYPSEAHTVQTSDGYLLTVHRIPGDKSGKRGGQPVFLQHGLMGSSADSILNENQSLAFNLADLGYDVWIGNARGNVYSKGHISYSLKSANYWNFSWHEMGVFDLPAVLYHVSNTTGKLGEIIYIGHSMGTTMFFVFSSLQPQAAKNVKLMIALAPTAYMTHVRSPIRYLAPFSNDARCFDVEVLIQFAAVFLPRGKVLQLLSYECEILERNRKKICEKLIFSLTGMNKQEFNMKVLPVIFAHDPAGTSTKSIIHYGQEIYADGQFQQYDYGTRINMIKYHQPNPPKYKIDKIRTPIYLMYAEKDKLTSPIDVLRLSHNLTNLVGIYRVPIAAFDHVDFIFGKDAKKVVNDQIFKVMHNFTNDFMV